MLLIINKRFNHLNFEDNYWTSQDLSKKAVLCFLRSAQDNVYEEEKQMEFSFLRFSFCTSITRNWFCLWLPR